MQYTVAPIYDISNLSSAAKARYVDGMIEVYNTTTGATIGVFQGRNIYAALFCMEQYNKTH